MASRPECVSHGSPWGFGVCAVVACPILSSHEARAGFAELYIAHAVLVARGFNGVVGPVFGELQGDAVGEERVLFLVEAVVLQGIGRPDGGLRVAGVEDFAVELAGYSQTPDCNKYLAKYVTSE